MKSETADLLIDGFTGKQITEQPINPFADGEGKLKGVTYITVSLTSDN